MQHLQWRGLALLGALCAANIPSALAAESYDNCSGFIDALPTVITTQGVWCLRKDLSTGISSGHAIRIDTNNVTLDCNGFKIGGLSAGVGTAAIGVGTDGYNARANVTVRNCSVRGFLRGIYVGGSSALVEDNRLEANTYAGITAWGDGTTVQRNQIVDTGGTTQGGGGYAYGIWTQDTVHVLDNTITGILPSPNGGNRSGYGIYTFISAGSIRGNRINHIVGGGSGGAFGIYNDLSGLVSVTDNHVASQAGTTGILCNAGQSAAKGNMVLGFSSPVLGCHDAGNTTP